MRKILLVVCAFLCFFSINVEARTVSSAQIKRYVDRTPRESENSSFTLVRYLTKPFDNDYDKAKAIAFWISSRIYYDDYIYNSGKVTKLAKKYNNQSSEELLKSRVGICGDFATLFEDLCNRAHIKVSSISGYAYPKGASLTSAQKTNFRHAWNFFMYKGKRIYVDTTFMARASMEAKGRLSDFRHKQALKGVKRDNKRKSQIHDFDVFYFDFTYNDEEKERKYARKEKYIRKGYK